MTESHEDRYVIDTNIFDKIVDGGFAEVVARLVAARRLVLVSTHVQRDEIERVKDRQRLTRLLEVPFEEVPTFGFVVGESRLGMARLGSEEPFESLRAGGDPMTRTRDALITMTAQFERAPLITEDQDARKRARSSGIRAHGWEYLRSRIEELAAESDHVPTT